MIKKRLWVNKRFPLLTWLGSCVSSYKNPTFLLHLKGSFPVYMKQEIFHKYCQEQYWQEILIRTIVIWRKTTSHPKQHQRVTGISGDPPVCTTFLSWQAAHCKNPTPALAICSSLIRHTPQRMLQAHSLMGLRPLKGLKGESGNCAVKTNL